MDTDLHKVIRSSQTLLDKHVQYFIYQILSALLHLKSKGVIHRDLKPSNIFVDLNCEIKIGDLGMSKVINDNKQDSFIPMTEYVATRYYRAPEIMMWKAYGYEVDTWSVGCIMAELLLRKPIFPGKDLQDQLIKIFKILGTPDKNFLKHISNQRIRKWINSQALYKKVNFESLFPKKTNRLAIDLIKKLLVYSPYKRISIWTALNHEYLKEFNGNNKSNKPPIKSAVRFPHEIENFSVNQMKSVLVTQLQYFAEINGYKPCLSGGNSNNNSNNNNDVRSPGIIVSPLNGNPVTTPTPMIITPVIPVSMNNNQMVTQNNQPFLVAKGPIYQNVNPNVQQITQQQLIAMYNNKNMYQQPIQFVNPQIIQLNNNSMYANQITRNRFNSMGTNINNNNTSTTPQRKRAHSLPPPPPSAPIRAASAKPDIEMSGC